MLSILTFIRDYEFVWYYLLGLVSLWFIYRIILAQFRHSKTHFDLERELFTGQTKSALARLVLIALVMGSVYFAIHIGLPIAENNERAYQAERAAHLPTPTITPTPYSLLGVDMGGCSNPDATILRPKPGETVRGLVTIRFTADIPNFAYFVIELARPDEPDVWSKVHTGTSTARNEEFIWNSARILPGVYNLKLTVYAQDESFPPSCIIPIQILAP
jgi:hypothetical protein